MRTVFHRRMRRRARHLVGRIADHIPSRAAVLDIGSGTGHNAEAFRDLGGGSCIEADVVDFHVVGQGPVLFDGCRLPFPDRSFDASLLAFVLSYVEDPAMLLREAERVARGRVLVLQSCPRGRAGLVALAFRGWAQGRLAFWACSMLGLIPRTTSALVRRRLLSRERMIDLVEEAGLMVVRVVPESGRPGLISRDLFVLEGRSRRPSLTPTATLSGEETRMNPTPPQISVIIPARNEAALIASTVGSVLAARDRYLEACSRGSGVEIIVVDNASEDGTSDILARLTADGRVQLATCEPRGAARARNLGARIATGRLLVFLDADTHLPPAALLRIGELVDTLGYEAGITRLGPLDGGVRARCWWVFWNAVRRLPLPRAKAMPACMFCTRDVFDELGPFDERVGLGEEWPILAGLYRMRPRRFIYDQTLTALSSGRRMELQRLGYTRTFLRYVWAVASFRGRVDYPDHVRHVPRDRTSDDRLTWGGDRC